MKKNKNILVVAAHPDDEILGCGGSLLYFRSKGYRIKVIFMAEQGKFVKLIVKKKIELINKREKQAKLVSNESTDFFHQFFAGIR